MNRIVQNIWDAIRVQNTEAMEPVFDDARPIRYTGDMRPWYTGRPCEFTKRSHINLCVYDSTWEATEAFELDRNANVDAWVKNDHLAFEIQYIYRGIRKKYHPDFLIRLVSGKMLVVEVKGKETHEDQVKREFLEQWIKAVNAHGGFGQWCCEVSREPKDLVGVLERRGK